MLRLIPTDIAATPFDAIIIGAGINGAGIARDAAMRGLRVLLLDKADISSGTSSWSSRLIHGGLRYLEHFEIGLVRESLSERKTLLRTAPHLVRPLPLMIPIYERGKRGKLMIRAGMILYDALSFDKSLARHRMLSRVETLRRAPGLEPDGLRGAAVYYDAQVEFAERLVVENALSASEHGATVLTYARVERLIIENDAVCGVEFTDTLHEGVYQARASVTLNVAGPWVDRVLAGTNRTSTRLLGGTKGSHLIVDAFDGAPAAALYVEAVEDGRPFFILPWNGRYLIGTTDRRFEGDLDLVEASEDETDYLLRETNRVIPSAKLTRDHILYTYSGVRPLPFVQDEAESGITRRHFIHDHAPALKNFLSIVGGKLTTYRSLSEQAVNIIFKKLEREPVACLTARRSLSGAATDNFKAFSAEFGKSKSEISEAALERLLRIYGTRAVEVLKLVEEDAELAQSFDAETGAIGAEIVLAFRTEMAETLSDSLLRRTMVGLNSAAGLNAIEAAARVAREHLGWTEDHAAQEVAAYRDYVRRFHPESLKKD
ncbi:MAG: glycerol-3-phosphate dehydrogenase [Pyrinomonadaceae bacterium]|nr:glycerol-3-phosphate dehydrogenase [Pyrinomonadaceae bacterium]